MPKLYIGQLHGPEAAKSDFGNPDDSRPMVCAHGPNRGHLRVGQIGWRYVADLHGE
jgi:hypothetical protein